LSLLRCFNNSWKHTNYIVFLILNHSQLFFFNHCRACPLAKTLIVSDLLLQCIPKLLSDFFLAHLLFFFLFLVTLFHFNFPFTDPFFFGLVIPLEDLPRLVDTIAFTLGDMLKVLLIDGGRSIVLQIYLERSCTKSLRHYWLEAVSLTQSR